METIQPLRKVEWLGMLFAALAIGLGAIAGRLVSDVPHPFLVLLFAGIGLTVVFGTLARPEWGLLFLVFLVYTRLSDVLVHEHGAPSVAQSYIPLLILVIFLRWGLHSERPAKWRRAALLVGAYGLVGFASLLYASQFAVAWDTLVAYAKDSIIAVVVVMLLLRPVAFRRVIWTLLVAAIFMGTLSMYQQLTGTFENNYLGFAEASLENIVGRTHDYRIGGPVGSPVFFGQILLVLVPLAVDRLWNERTLVLRVLAGWALVATVVTIFFTFSRGAFLGLIVVAVLLLLRQPPRPLTIIATIVVAVVLLQFVPARYTQRMGTLLDFFSATERARILQDVGVAYRAKVMGAAWVAFTEHPLLGIGLGNFEGSYMEYATRLGVDPGDASRAAHSLYLEIGAELGLVGLTVFGVLLWQMFRALRRARIGLEAVGDASTASLVGALTIGMIGYLAAALFLQDSFPRFFWLLFGIAMATPQVAENALAASHEETRRET